MMIPTRTLSMAETCKLNGTLSKIIHNFLRIYHPTNHLQRIKPECFFFTISARWRVNSSSFFWYGKANLSWQKGAKVIHLDLLGHELLHLWHLDVFLVRF